MRLRTAMDSTFWDLDVATPRVLEGSAKAVPGEPFPMDATRASGAIRIQQVSFLGNGFPLGIIPSYFPTSSVISPFPTVTTGSKSEACGVERVIKFRARNEDRQAEEDHHIGMSDLCSSPGF
ncbi:hypothetical protein G4B88_008085 [Cannabis sativa]|uniref:Uncharacterized protein n=1 Tax=Cannabis sativa TaxID=3483 RepID=A0A7J6I8V3_CANSA|nr:hypothetical protein G4B88_008085 [Cannabis sativa]